MIVSIQKGFCIFLNPKTGTTTLYDIFKDKPYVDYAVQDHLDYRDLKVKYPDADNIALYAFYRNPVDRFISAYSFAMENRSFILASRMYNYYIDPEHVNAFNTNTGLNDEQMDRVRALSIKEIFTHKDFKLIMSLLFDISPVFLPQVNWLDYEGMNLLNFEHFEDEVKKLLTLYDDSDIVPEIPKLNAVEPAYRNLTQEETDLIKSLYERDYQFFASKNITF